MISAYPELNDNCTLATLNADDRLDITNLIDNYLHADDEAGIFSDINIKSEYFNCQTLYEKTNIKNRSLFLSINIQSLQSKFSNLLQLINELNTAKVTIDIIALQETWNISHVDQLIIPGFHPVVYINRTNLRGGGVGFFINSSLKFSVLTNFPSLPKTFENIVIDITYPNQHLTLSCIYRSPTPNQGTTTTNHIDEFMVQLDNHLSRNNDLKTNAYVFLDANINLHSINSNNNSREYLNTVVSNGFLPTITKATRVQNDSATFIDQILTNVTNNTQNAWTIITDVSDHFCNFISIPQSTRVKASKNKKSRDFNETNYNRFLLQLGHIDWSCVTGCNDVDMAFDEFWNIFSTLYDLNFPYKSYRQNKSVFPINCFMTPGLVISRNNKYRIHMLAIKLPTAENVNKYKTYRNIFNSLIRKSKNFTSQKI